MSQIASDIVYLIVVGSVEKEPDVRIGVCSVTYRVYCYCKLKQCSRIAPYLVPALDSSLKRNTLFLQKYIDLR